MVRRHEPMHLRGERARAGSRPKRVSRPTPEPAKAPAHAAPLGKTAAKGLHFRPAPQARYIRRRPRHFRPVGTLRTSSTVLATFSLPLAALSMLGLPATIAAAGPTRSAVYLAAPKPVRGKAGDKLARANAAATLTAFTGVDHPVAPASSHSGGTDYVFGGANYPFGVRNYLFGGPTYAFDGFYHLQLPTKKPKPAMVKLAAPGSIAAFGNATFLGAPAGHSRDIVGITVSGSGQGYWAVGSGGGVFSYGDARFLGSLASDHRSRQMAGIAATPSGDGYWLASKDGDVFSFGDAKFYGSLGNEELRSTVVGIAALPDGRGYWLATANGGVYTFGDARYYGSLGNTIVKQAIVGIAASPTGRGYWLATAGGGVCHRCLAWTGTGLLAPCCRRERARLRRSQGPRLGLDWARRAGQCPRTDSQRRRLCGGNNEAGHTEPSPQFPWQFPGYLLRPQRSYENRGDRRHSKCGCRPGGYPARDPDLCRRCRRADCR
jgi:hypothetical protein